MSESTDDAQLRKQGEVAPLPGEAPATPASDDADDVEVVAQAEPAPAPRHDSVTPTSRKLAPPPKPKRDSSNPGSVPPSGTDGLSSVAAGALKAPSAPSISFQDPSTSSRDAVAAALAGGESLRAIGEALAKDAGAFSTTETPTGGRPPVPRPRAPTGSSPDAPASSGGPLTRPSPDLLEVTRDKLPTTPDDPPVSAAPKSSSILAQRIISVGTPSDRPLARSAPPPPIDLDRTLETSSSVAEHVRTAEPPPVAAPPVVPPPMLLVPPPMVAPPVAAAADESVDIPIDEGPPDIPITTDEMDEDTPTAPHAAPAPFTPPPPPLNTAPEIPDEPTPPPPLMAKLEMAKLETALPAPTPAPAEQLGPEDVAPDSADRIQVEELSREDSPSVPPDEPTPAAPPPAPSARAEAKQPPPPPKRAPAPPPAEISSPEVAGEKKKSKQKRPWWEELFSEDFVRAQWKVSDEQIKREVTFVEESLGVAPGGVVLDLGCGSGQHAVELASRGYGVVGYDLSLYQLALAADIAQERSQKINFLQGDMREMAFEEMFDGIFCWNTSFGYFEEDKNYSVAERAFRALRPGGMFLVDVVNRDFVAAHTPSSVWFEGDSCVCMDDAVIDYFTSRLRVKRSVILDDGRTRECTYSVRLYSFHELGKLLHEVGFRVTEVSGHPATPGVFLGQASPRILMLAQRP
jgi:SAM-dependent methyltransferase